MTSRAQGVEIVRQPERIEVLMHPLRVRILEAAREPGSAAELARRLEEKPQTVNYHVRRLADHGFLELADERRAGNVVEKVFVSTARSYVLASDVLGELAPSMEEADPETVGGWLAVQTRTERELGELMERTGAGSASVHAFSVDEAFRFETAEQWALFGRAVGEFLPALFSKYTSPVSTETGDAGSGRPYRLILGCFPIPEPSSGKVDEAGDGDTPAGVADEDAAEAGSDAETTGQKEDTGERPAD